MSAERGCGRSSIPGVVVRTRRETIAAKGAVVGQWGDHGGRVGRTSAANDRDDWANSLRAIL